MYRIITLFLLTIFLLRPALSQDITIEGEVIDAATGNPIEGCEIISGQYGTISNALGKFLLSGTLTEPVTVRHIAYEPQTIDLTEFPTLISLNLILLQGESISVYGALRTQSLLESDGGITVISKRDIDQNSEPHFQGLMDNIPNLNWAGGSSRPRYFQIRGMGERSQFAGDGPPNYSVGFSIDDIDLSGIGMSGLTFDANRIELFRGPQSSIYGPNALAGFIVLRSNDPGSERDGFVSITGGNANTLNLGTAFNLLTGNQLKARLSAYRGYNNGFQHNEYLNSHTTNERMETMGRLKVHWAPSPKLDLKTTLLYVKLDNGYDVWSPDNAGFTTYSDNPGKDTQELRAGILRFEYELLPSLNVYSISGVSISDMVNSYDGDWGNDAFWAGSPYNFDPVVEGWSYDFFDRVARLRETVTQEVRIVHTNSSETLHLIGGVYLKNLVESDDAEGYLFGGDESELESEFNLQNTSFYGQIDYALMPQLTATANFRVGQRKTDYEDDKSTSFSMSDELNGGKVALLYSLNERQMIFVNTARGFKAGGINQHPRILDANRPFSPEYVDNYEVGFRGISNRGMLSILAFYTKRMDQQVSLSSQQDPTDPNSFTYYIGNASNGHASGVELEFNRELNSLFKLTGSLGLLESNTEEYTFEVAPGQFVSLGDRAFAHAPHYSYRLGLGYKVNDKLDLNASISGKDEFYFSESHDQHSEAYNLVNTRITYSLNEKIDISAWADNIFDTKYATRGFYFGLEPPIYEDKLYMSYGDPLHFGFTLKYNY